MEVTQVWKRSWLEDVKNIEEKNRPQAEVIFVSSEEKWNTQYCDKLPIYLKSDVAQKKSILHAFNTPKSLIRVLTPHEIKEAESQWGQLGPSDFGFSRDLVGTCLRELIAQKVGLIKFTYYGTNSEELKGILVGLEMSAYHFKQLNQKNYLPPIKFLAPKCKSIFENIKSQALLLAQSVNLSRYLVDLPPNEINPETFAQLAQQLFVKNKTTTLEVWDDKVLQKENMNLHSSVGKASNTPSRLVLIKYRGDETKKEHFAFVGKGVTFDSGGLDIKPSSGMRYMKKDMGGAASLLGLAYWLSNSKLKINVNFYFALAENAISGNAFRPGDILKSRNGKTVEIHNTDAEGRLVMADSLALASESKPKWIIDVATLTGAMKASMGSAVAGVFSNSDKLCEELLKQAQIFGEGLWPMPLIPGERKKLKSEVADLINANDGFGGAVTAALFLEEFVAAVPWAHFDIYSWVDGAEGPYAHKGGNGQFVQTLSGLLSGLAQSPV